MNDLMKLRHKIEYDLHACNYEDCNDCLAYLKPVSGNDNDCICLGLLLLEYKRAVKQEIMDLLEKC